MAKLKLIVACVLALLGLIVVVQNTTQVDVRLLFVKVSMPLAILLLGTIILGFALGVILTLVVMWRQSVD